MSGAGTHKMDTRRRAQSRSPDQATDSKEVKCIGQVGERLKPTDCKSVRPCGVRRFESFPVHQFCALDRKAGEKAFLSRVRAVVAQLVEHFLGKEEVTGSIPVNGSRIRCSKWADCQETRAL